MFGLRGFYRGRKIFAALQSRAPSRIKLVIFESISAAETPGAAKTERVSTPKTAPQCKVLSFMLNSEATSATRCVAESGL